jgi:uncharacterized protein YceK
MKLLAILLALTLSGCSTVVPVTQPWPDAPGKLAQEPCVDLQKLTEAPQLSQVAKTVVNNYSEYYQCAVKLEAWQRWYQEQKIIHERLR